MQRAAAAENNTSASGVSNGWRLPGRAGGRRDAAPIMLDLA